MTFKPMTLAASTILALAITGPAVAAVDARQAVLVLPALRRQPPLRLVRRCAHRAGRVSGPKRDLHVWLVRNGRRAGRPGDLLELDHSTHTALHTAR